MGLDQHAHLRGHKVDWDKYYEDDKEENEKVFVWRKHARLQQFMSAKWDEQNTTHKHEGHLAHLGFCLLYTSPSPRDRQKSRMPSSA